MSSVREQSPPVLPDREYELAAELRQTLTEFLRHSERITRKHGLTNERYELLLLIKVAGEDGDHPTVTELADTLQLAKSTVTQLVRRAEDLRLVRRELSDRDARVRYLRLTAEGERRLRDAVTELQDERARLVALVGRLQ
ncbi:MAG TPA: MarR family transcriptional regulator [Gaiellaceae bacterium]|nr:MarR family transcriptional regulator [Gaiellaceae bacterium]